MKFESAVELQAKVFADVFGFTEIAAASGEATGGSILVDPVLLDESIESLEAGVDGAEPARRAPRAAEDIALGVSDSGDIREEAKLAVLVQREEYLNSTVIDDIRRLAHDEIDLVYIGRQEAFWTRTRRNPIRIGSSVAPSSRSYSGTLGCFCTDNQTGRTCILSNNHVLADVNLVPLNTRVVQPSRPDGGVPGSDDIAELIRFIPIQFGGIPNLVDAALAGVTHHGRQEDHAGIWDCTTPGQPAKTFRPASVASVLPGMRVFKTGRTTCHTVGTVRAINVNNYRVNMGGTRGVARFDNQITVQMAMNPPAPFSRPGDSGSVIVNAAGEAVGLLFAGSQSGGPGDVGITAANPISAVVAQLGITLI